MTDDKDENLDMQILFLKNFKKRFHYNNIFLISLRIFSLESKIGDETIILSLFTCALMNNVQLITTNCTISITHYRQKYRATPWMQKLNISLLNHFLTHYILFTLPHKHLYPLSHTNLHPFFHTNVHSFSHTYTFSHPLTDTLSTATLTSMLFHTPFSHAYLHPFLHINLHPFSHTNVHPFSPTNLHPSHPLTYTLSNTLTIFFTH